MLSERHGGADRRTRPSSELRSPIAEQLRRQTQPAPAGDPLAGLDVVIRVPIDDHQVAAVVKRPGWLAAFSRVGDPEREIRKAVLLRWPT